MAYNTEVLYNSNFYASVGIDITFVPLRCINASHNSAFPCNSRWNDPAEIGYASHRGYKLT